MKIFRIVSLVLLLGTLAVPTIAQDNSQGNPNTLYTIRNKDYKVEGYYKDGVLRDKNYHVTGYVRPDGAIRDRNYKVQGHYKGGYNYGGGKGEKSR